MSSDMVFRDRFNGRKALLTLAGALLALMLFIFEASDLDLWIQDLLYSPNRGAWVLSKNAALPRMVFYHGPKILLITFGAWLLCSLAFPRRWKIRQWLSTRHPRELLYLLICISLFPASIGGIKKVSGIHCPSELSRYGGDHPYRKLFSPRIGGPHAQGHCFPAGHSSGGFALLGLYFVAKRDRSKKAALVLGLGAGWLMGLYQMLVGAHFLSHTVTTMMLAWIFTLSAAFFLPRKAPPASEFDAAESHFSIHSAT